MTVCMHGDDQSKCISCSMLAKRPDKQPPSKNLFEVSVADGKYTVIAKEGGGLYALRYGEPWQDLTGNGLVFQLACELSELKSKDKL